MADPGVLSGQLVEALAAAEQPEEDRSRGGVACTRLHMRKRHRSSSAAIPSPASRMRSVPHPRVTFSPCLL